MREQSGEGDGRRLRPLGMGEMGLDVVETQMGSGHMVRMISFDGRVDAAVLERAVARTVARVPLLRCRIARPLGEPPFFERVDAAVPFTVVERDGDDDWHAAFEHELNTSLPADGEALVRCRLLASADPGGEIFLSVHHSVADGRSIQELCNRVVREYEALIGGTASDDEGSGAATMTIDPPADALLPEWMRGERLESMTAELRRTKPLYFGKVSPASFASERGTSTALPVTRVVHDEMSPEDLQTLRASARANGTTMTGALVASFLLAAIESGRVDVTDPPVVVNSVDLRPHLRQNVPLERMGEYGSGVSLVLPQVTSSTFWELAREVRAQNVACIDQHEHLLVLALMEELAKRAADLHRYPGLGQFANLGQVALPESPTLRVRSVHGGLPLHGYMSPLVYCFAVSVAGRLMLNLFYPYPEVSDETVSRLRDRMRAHLRANTTLSS